MQVTIATPPESVKDYLRQEENLMPAIELDIIDPSLNDIFDRDAEIEIIADGFKFLEGPAWHPYAKHLRFSDILGNSILQWSADAGFSLFARNSHMSNGNTYDRDGRFLSCHHASSRVTRCDDSESVRVLASHFAGKELNSPNDIVVKRDGSVYFTDPPYGREPKVGIPRERQLDFNGVYRWHPADDSLSLLTKALNRPNGLCFSADETLLYINDSPEYKIFVFDVADDGTIGNRRLFAETQGDGPGVPDGMKLDSDGNLYCCAQGGLHVFRADGSKLGRLRTPMQVTNFTWGDSDLSSLYLTGITTLYRVRARIPGTPLF